MPLLFDMPLEKLYEYKGVNPRPADHDKYWADALAEMKAVDPKIELRKAEFQIDFAECYDMFFTGVRDARLHAKLLKPKNAQPSHPGLVQFHGYAGNSGDWFGKLPYVAMGYTIASLDCRGQGGLSEDTGGVKGTTLRGHIVRGLDDKPENMLFRHMFLDTAQLAGIVMDMDDVDENRVGAFGGSQGGALTLACASLEPRIKRAAPTFPFLCDFRRVWDIDQCERAYEELKTFFRLHDPLHERETEIFTQLGYIDLQFLANRIKAEILMAVGLQDTICPPSTQFAAYNKITSKKQLVIYPDYGHELLPRWDDKVLQFMAAL